MIRAFVGLRIPEQVTRELVAFQAGLPAGRPVPPENLHLTLAFLGERPEPVIEDAHHALCGIRSPRFEVSLLGLDLLGGARSQALGILAEPNPALTALNGRVRQAARMAGIELGRERYTPHVTLARFARIPGGEDGQRLRDFTARGAGLRAGPFQVESFFLIRSWLGQGGAIYDDLAEYALG